MNIIDAIAALFNSKIMRLKLRFTQTTAQVVGSIVKLEAKLEAAINKDMIRLNELADLRNLVEAARNKTDNDVNAAYKLLHNVSVLTR